MRQPSSSKAGSMCNIPTLSPTPSLSSSLLPWAPGQQQGPWQSPKRPLVQGSTGRHGPGKSSLWSPHSPELSWKQQEVIFKKQQPSAVTWETSLSPSSALWAILLGAQQLHLLYLPKGCGRRWGNHLPEERSHLRI